MYVRRRRSVYRDAINKRTDIIYYSPSTVTAGPIFARSNPISSHGARFLPIKSGPRSELHCSAEMSLTRLIAIRMPDVCIMSAKRRQWRGGEGGGGWRRREGGGRRRRREELPHSRAILNEIYLGGQTQRRRLYRARARRRF